VHGFIPLEQVDIDAYEDFQCIGMTALFDATFSALGASLAYAQTLVDKDFDVNGIAFVITDGGDNFSKYTLAEIKDSIQKARQEEMIESLQVVLVGINAFDCIQYLEDFKNDAGIDQFIDVGDVTPQKLAKLAKFVSQSISSQSKALGTGAPSTPLTF
jgi:hypothetical protein